jgi:tetratricopeptide (TPR) repeat protein
VSITKFHVGFSPDGRWLVSFTLPDGSPVFFQFWRVGTWKPELRIDVSFSGTFSSDPPAFTCDGRLMALRIAPDQVLLAEPATGRELARLTTLQPVISGPFAFSPDGTRLIAGTSQGTVLVWDLRRIREQLAPMGVDWDAPPYPSASASIRPSGPLPPPRSVRVVGEVVAPRVRRAAELAEMNRRLAARPDDAEALFHRGWLCTLQKKLPEAIADLERGLQLKPNDHDALFLLAESQSQANDLPAARATLEKYLARSVDDVSARLMKGRLALQLGRLQEAVDDFTKVLDADPLGRAPLRLSRALIFNRLSKFHEALADLNRMIERNPREPLFYEIRSQVQDRLGRHELALADLKKAVESPGAGAQFYNDHAWRLATGPAAVRDPEQALVLARKAVALTPGTAACLNTLGVTQYRAGQFAGAIATLERSLAAGKGQSDAFDLFFLAMAHQQLGHTDQAHACFDRAVHWCTEHKDLPAQYVAELTAFRGEAEVVQGLTGPIGELPADVFALGSAVKQ